MHNGRMPEHQLQEQQPEQQQQQMQQQEQPPPQPATAATCFHFAILAARTLGSSARDSESEDGGPPVAAP